MRYVLLVLVMLIGVWGKGQDSTHFITFGGIEYDEGIAIKKGPDDNFYFLAATGDGNSNGSSDILLVKLDSFLNPLWSTTFGYSNVDFPQDIAFHPDSGIYIIGFTNSYGNGGYDILLLNISFEGNHKWDKTFGTNEWDFGKSLVIANDSIILASQISTENNNYDISLITTNLSGEQIFSYTFEREHDQQINKMIKTYDRCIVLCGSSVEGLSGKQAFILKLTKSWSVEFDSYFGYAGNNALYDIIQFTDSSYWGIGFTDGAYEGLDRDIYLVHFNQEGAPIYTDIRGRSNAPEVPNQDDEGMAIALTKHNRLILSGYTKTHGQGNADIFVTHLDTSGADLTGSSTIGSPYFESIRSVLPFRDGLLGAGKTNELGNGQFDALLYRRDSITSPMSIDSRFHINSGIPFNNIVTSSEEINPNITPASKFHISNRIITINNNEMCHISVIDITGRVLLKTKGNQIIIPKTLPTGIYIIDISGNSGYYRQKLFLN